MRRISLPATRDSVAEVARRVAALSRAGGLSADRSYRLRLAAEEMATNIIVHGYDEASERPPDPDFVLEWGCEGDQVWLCLVDSARPFDPTGLPTPSDLDDPLSQRTEGGLGIHLARTSLDGFTYERSGGRNRVTLAIKRVTAPQDGATDGAADRPHRR